VDFVHVRREFGRADCNGNSGGISRTKTVPLRKTKFQTQHTAAQKQWAAGISGGNFNGTACFGSAETRGAK
jgi:hypothetical protein